MAGFFTHMWIANLVLKELKNKNFLSSFENIDDYFFGSIAPDIRYVANSTRDITHQPYGNDSLFEALKASTTSMPFIAGYEVHLITDFAWSNDKKWRNESIYEHYHIDSNNLVQKFTLYGLADDYFQAEADWYFPLICAGNILRANDFKIFYQLGFNQATIQFYKMAVSLYLKEPGIDTINQLSFLPNNHDEELIAKFLDAGTGLTNQLQEFKRIAIEQSVAALRKYI